MRKLVLFSVPLLFLSFLCSCEVKVKTANTPKDITVAEYFNYGDTGVQSAGIKMIPIQTPAGTFKVWTKRFGNNPRIKVLLLHGGPAAGHEYMECFESFFPKEGFEFYEYDQLGAPYSDQPTDSSLWTIPRYVDEVEQVRKAIGADATNFYVLGNSWGGILAMEYALKYQKNLKGLIVADMVASCPDYGRYAYSVLAKQMDPKVLQEIKAIEAKGDFSNPRYEELLMPNFYQQHICRLNPWPDPVVRAFTHLDGTKVSKQIYVMMQGPSEFGIAGRLTNWDIKNRLKEISVPTLMVGAKYDTMDPKAMEEQSKMVQHGSYLYCPNGSHMCMWDDQQVFMNGVIKWIKEVDAK
ncbi:proline iminopeptidase-family hydrolase [Flavisolibacter ginsenosidimutans]|uniref:Alpha/beta fold hydrolase n=1 Tax=Flavisolibacter ginsenosidimutans TaxID=661481 RepID=A0A5B8UFY1_9BACT|nr:proline iminopeptidase-family hydrolase [Flavisolibacter ginsenosidimutans]QEC55581.1 alpha/beta fold hydrolase [Flavisolibacter ginsenosidimutans]